MGVARIAAAAATICALGFGLAYVVAGVRSQSDTVRRNETYAPQVRVAGGAEVIDVDRSFVAAAVAYAGGSERFAVETGPRVPVSTQNTLRFIAAFFRGRLLPAQLVPPAKAQWLLCYGCNPGNWPAFKPVWGSPPYVVAKRVS